MGERLIRTENIQKGEKFVRVNKLNILSNVQISDRYWHMVVDSDNISQPIQPGQFFNIKCSDEGYPFLRRPFSIYRINKNENTIEFLYLVKGVGTQRLTLLKENEKIDVFGPLGVGFSLDPEWRTILLVARGVGIATLAALAQEATERNVKCMAILSAKSNHDLLAADTLQRFGAEVYKVTEEDGTSDVKNVRHMLEKIFTKHKIDGAFTCGSKRLSRLLQEMTNKYGIKGQIALEEHMGCAMGVCYACVCNLWEGDRITSVRVCRDGPVFDLEKVVLT